MRLYTTTNYALARLTRNYFNIKTSEIDLVRFADGEVLVMLPEAYTRGSVVLIQTLSTPVNDAIIHTVFALEALKLACVNNIILIISYLGYARQDRLTCAHSLISCSTVCKLLCLNAPARVYLLEPHAPQIVGFLNAPSFSFGLTAAICEHISRLYKLSELVIIALDHGAEHRALKVSKALDVEMISGYKHRENGLVTVAFQYNPRLTGKTGVIIDDIIDTGKSVASAARTLLTAHLLQRVLVYCVHGVLSGELPKCVELCVSNSIPRKHCSVDAAYTISRLIKRVLAGASADELLL
ncbi:Ribose-phosphate pyrophosphokinase [Candidatus Hodgkinia cicadicola]|nr:Ribose-phosphate pyrophosphokinase [Candidatus Hodgkinia cicadicola]